MSPKRKECHYTDKEEFKLPPSRTIVSSGSYIDVSTLNGSCSSSGSMDVGYVYKRMRFQRNSLALLPEPNHIKDTKQGFGSKSSINSEDKLLEVPKADTKTSPAVVRSTRNAESVHDSGLHHLSSIEEFDIHDQASNLDHCHSLNDRCSSSKSNVELTSTFSKRETINTYECSTSDILEPREFKSTRELCIHVLKKHRLLGNSRTRISHYDIGIMSNDNSELSQKCKICGLFENPLKMLICDECNEAHHQSCCVPRLKQLPVNEWYCLPCFKKKPKHLMNKSSKAVGKSSNHTNRKNSILFMLKDHKPYTTGVRIGKDFQVEVTDWSGHTSDEDDYFNEPYKMDTDESVNSNVWNGREIQYHCNIGNWVQCKEVIYSNRCDKGTICGKWRRAPLFTVQSEDWDCSCAIQWDPIHADCVVPQELATEEISLAYDIWLELWLHNVTMREAAQSHPTQTQPGSAIAQVAGRASLREAAVQCQQRPRRWTFNNIAVLVMTSMWTWR
ncbi:hypothetical protein ZIOFF_065209 [Zingiber officinale]|uniref:Uncharacterized protein n=1 Tax=Zingiber officinale TaxID=94328 RepID=A0A8J5EX37_ZINOF|nr:hypothetical protein ZIOFF_065209 [Zingiber officinale]